jgi:hypothetical protein
MGPGFGRYETGSCGISVKEITTSGEVCSHLIRATRDRCPFRSRLPISSCVKELLITNKPICD